MVVKPGQRRIGERLDAAEPVLQLGAADMRCHLKASHLTPGSRSIASVIALMDHAALAAAARSPIMLPVPYGFVNGLADLGGLGSVLNAPPDHLIDRSVPGPLMTR